MPQNKRYELHPEARIEIEGADHWYSERSPDAADDFIETVHGGIANIAKASTRWPRYFYGTRRYLLPKFPFSIVYLDETDTIKIVAVAHHKRKPGYWKSRI